MAERKAQRNPRMDHEKDRIPSKEEVLDMITEGLQQAKSREGLRPASEALKEIREELQSEMAADVNPG